MLPADQLHHPLLTHEQEVALGHRIQAGDAAALDELVCHNPRIAVYGRCLLAGVQPTAGETLRMVAALRRYVPYIYAAGRLTTDLDALRQLQEEIARCVAKGV